MERNVSLWGDVNSGGARACVGIGSICEFSVFSAQFCHEPKTALKDKVYVKRVCGDILHLYRWRFGFMLHVDFMFATIYCLQSTH